MGRYYARHDGEDPEVADAIRDHYKPLARATAFRPHRQSMAVALADKIDSLAQFFAADERPTGSRDPFALRRAALGMIRTMLENKCVWSCSVCPSCVALRQESRPGASCGGAAPVDFIAGS